MEEALSRFIELMNANDLTELELEDEGTRIRIKKGREEGVAPAATIVTKAQAAPSDTSEVAAVETGPAARGAEPNLVEIPSPLVGTFYRSPTPDAPPFVDPGDAVDTDTVLCIVEAMKVMNEIKSEVEGEVVEVFAESGEPVEYGQVLFLIRPSQT